MSVRVALTEAERRITKVHKENLRVMEMFTVSIVVKVSQA